LITVEQSQPLKLGLQIVTRSEFLGGRERRHRLFDVDNPDAQISYRNLRAAEFPVEKEIKAGPFADANFREEFSRQPDNRFWEMYLSVRLLDAAKKVRSKAEVARAVRDVGPDVCIQKGTRRIWIEAVLPDQGHENNPDRVADWPAEERRIDAEEQRRQVELRITTALNSKIVICVHWKTRRRDS